MIPRRPPTRKPDAYRKAVVAAYVLHELALDRLDLASANAALRRALNTNHWNVLIAVQFLTGKDARTALEALPADFSHQGVPRALLLTMIAFANDIAANASPGGGYLSTGLDVKRFRRTTGLVDDV